MCAKGGRLLDFAGSAAASSTMREVVSGKEDSGRPGDDQHQHDRDEPRRAALLLRGRVSNAEYVDEGAGEEAEGIH